LAQRARVPAIRALVSSTGVHACRVLVNEDLNVRIRIRRYPVLKKRPEETMRSEFVEQLVTLVLCREKLKPITVCRSKKAEKRLRGGIYLPTTFVQRFPFYSRFSSYSLHMYGLEIPSAPNRVYSFIPRSLVLGRVFRVASSNLCIWNSLCYWTQDDSRSPRTTIRKATDISKPLIHTNLRSANFQMQSILDSCLLRVFDVYGSGQLVSKAICALD